MPSLEPIKLYKIFVVSPNFFVLVNGFNFADTHLYYPLMSPLLMFTLSKK